jgi:hypothetical protein
VVALLAVSANAAPLETSSDHFQKFSTHDPRPHPPVGDAGGESFADAVDMMALPFSDADNLWNYADDIDFGYGTSPDCVYQFTPDFDGCVTVDLCGSNYDSMLWIVAADQTTIVAWNDDGAACDATQSQISWMNIYNGELLYYVVDGYGGQAGDFVLDVFVRDCPPPPECPPGAILEGEGCSDPYDDNYNNGCNGSLIWQEIACSDAQIVVCGTTFNHYTGGGGGARDTDWYRLIPHEIMTITATSYYESSGSLYYIVDTCGDCGTGCVGIPAGVHIGSRELGTLIFDIDPAIPFNGIFQSKNYYDGTWYYCTDPESWPYVLTVDGFYCPATPNDTETWGGVKNLFK